MFDELDRLREVKNLLELLLHYRDAGAADRMVWQDRVAEMPGIASRELVQFHGELVAHGWIEQNTGITPVLKVGAAPACYRITSAGLRALKQVQTETSHAA